MPPVVVIGDGIGMCGAPTTGKIVSDLVCGREPAIDLQPFSARRF